MVSVFRVKARVIDEIDAATDDVSRRECRTIRLSRARRAERMAIITVITV